MKKLLGRLPLFSVALIFIISFCFSAVSALGGSESFVSAFKETEVAGLKPLKDEGLWTLYTADSSKEYTASSSQAVAVSASESDAIGKIYEQFLSPYSAKLSYNGIYIKNSTGLDINIKDELAQKLTLKIEDTNEPQVLIVHTHATESYMMEERGFYTADDKARNTDNTKNVVKVGDVLAETLEAGGIKVIHDKTQHDYPEYTGSYNRANKTISEYLARYPSIKVVVDLHRDSIAMTGNDKAKPTVKIDGKKAAQVMLVVGSETKSVTDFPNWRENFHLALRYQQTMEVMYPGFARTMTFCSNRYNMHLTTGSMLLEVGTDSNTLEEACYSAELAGKALVSLLNTLR